ncbi:MAG: transposase [Candidatus Omnitrophota bacterium]
MPRIARLVAVDLPHHITQRGNYQNDIFKDDADKQMYMEFISEASKKFDLTILAYCLMNNHVHFIAIPREANSLAKTFNTAHMRYSQYFNKRQGVKGHLWQGRFYSCVLDEGHFLAAIRYIERNPVRAKIVKKAWEWKYSSAGAHIGKDEKYLNSVKQIFKYIDFNEKSWKEYIERQDKEEDKKQIKKHTMNGRPLGEASFIAKLEKNSGRRLHALAWGRPPKAK